MDSESKILGHHTILINYLNTSFLEFLREGLKLVVPVELCAECETTGPSKDGGDWVCRRLLTLLVLPPVTSDST